MAYPEKQITDFIGEHHILTLAIAKDNQPYCATCYYTYLESQNSFVFTSDHDTRHIRDMVDSNNFRVAGAIALETKIVGKIRGIQFTGLVCELKGDQLKDARSAYLNRFPVARLVPGLHLWLLEPDFIKDDRQPVRVWKKTDLDCRKINEIKAGCASAELLKPMFF